MANFYVDNDVAQDVTTRLRALDHRVAAARDLGLAGAGDPEQLLVASQRDAVFLTQSKRDFYLLHDAWLRWTRAWGIDRPHPGILITPKPMAAPEIVGLVEGFLASGRPLVNRLYRWQSATGWHQYGSAVSA